MPTYNVSNVSKIFRKCENNLFLPYTQRTYLVSVYYTRICLIYSLTSMLHYLHSQSDCFTLIHRSWCTMLLLIFISRKLTVSEYFRKRKQQIYNLAFGQLLDEIAFLYKKLFSNSLYIPTQNVCACTFTAY